MAFIFGDRVKETSLTVGTGDMILGGPTAGFVSFGTGVGMGNECFYGILDLVRLRSQTKSRLRFVSYHQSKRLGPFTRTPNLLERAPSGTRSTSTC